MTQTRTTALSRSMPWMIVVALTAMFTLVAASLFSTAAGAQEDGIEDGSGTEQDDSTSDDSNDEGDDSEGEACEGRHGKRGHFGSKAGLSRPDLAALIGIEQAELREALTSGMSLADVATANGVDPQVLVDAIVESINERVDAMLEAGVIDEDRAAEIRAVATERAEAKVNHTWSPDDDGHRRHRRGHGRWGSTTSDTAGTSA